MDWRKKLRESGLLYIIIDKEVTDKEGIDILPLAEELSSSDADIFQLRAKDVSDRELFKLASVLSDIFSSCRKMFVVNDRVDIAYLCNTDGVHLGENDLFVEGARRIIGNEKIIGRTTHSLEEYCEQLEKDIDYLSIGPVFPTKTKPDLAPLGVDIIREIGYNKPTFFIGGIKEDNISAFARKNVAICRGVLLAKDRIDTIRRIKQCLRKV